MPATSFEKAVTARKLIQDKRFHSVVFLPLRCSVKIICTGLRLYMRKQKRSCKTFAFSLDGAPEELFTVHCTLRNCAKIRVGN